MPQGSPTNARMSSGERKSAAVMSSSFSAVTPGSVRSMRPSCGPRVSITGTGSPSCGAARRRIRVSASGASSLVVAADRSRVGRICVTVLGRLSCRRRRDFRAETAVVEGAAGLLIERRVVWKCGTQLHRPARLDAAQGRVENLRCSGHRREHERNADERGEAQRDADEFSLASQRRSHEDYSSRERRTRWLDARMCRVNGLFSLTVRAVNRCPARLDRPGEL